MNQLSNDLTFNIKTSKLLYGDKMHEVTPELVAMLFSSLCSDEQAIFFNHVAEIADRFDYSFPMQLQYVTDDNGLNLHGRRIMQSIGEYSHWGLSCRLTRGRYE